MAKKLNRSTGICIGANSVKIVEIDSDYRITNRTLRVHDCNPKDVLNEVVGELSLEDSYVTITGRKFKDLLNLPSITEPEASELALREWEGDGRSYNALVSLGSENFIVYVLDKNRGITQVKTGNKCASGTGEFFLQQIGRMGVGIDEAVELGRTGETHHLSGRCSVFCKSDCTHALNLGTPLGNVCAGLADMIADKVIDLLKSTPREDIILVGGVTRNACVVQKLKERIQDLRIPEEAEYFEAWGAAIHAMESRARTNGKVTVRREASSFSTLPPLEEYQEWVEFKDHETGVPQAGDRCILGLDVGSTTTKAVLLRTSDDAILASIYLRTNGNPVGASRECYQAIHEQLAGTDVEIVGLGVCGSGRKIAGLHALTDGIINEIIAHATGATYFDPDVDTILEIGGQDAKYTYLVNGVPCDYAMNEACSAGTGSFLEEAAKESLNIDYQSIQDMALLGRSPPNFNDQCAAFISSDIKNAGHENIPREDIVAGLVYSICMNYTNRVKGARKVGEKVFMQGGVCYNKAVPLAMASLLKKPIVVPPEPGLTGAFGVALEVKNRIANGLMEPASFDLEELMAREVEYGKTFACPGTPEDCDRKCQIRVIRMNGKNYAFGGICNKYYNLQHKIAVDPGALDYVERRQDIFWGAGKNGPEAPVAQQELEPTAHARARAANPVPKTNGKRAGGLPVLPPKPIRTIGLLRSFYQHNLYLLYHSFFTHLGFEVVVSDEVDPDGVRLATSSFCYPGELAFGMFRNLLDKEPDVIFLPKVAQLFVEKSKAEGWARHSTCCLAANEPFYLRSCFRDTTIPILTPVLEFHGGWETMEKEFVELGGELGRDPDASAAAYQEGVEALESFNRKKKELGREVLRKLEEDPEAIAVVILGRAYNSLADEANFGIPRKFASRGVYVVPLECLPHEEEESIENMSWAAGHDIMRSARYVKKHPQLFAAYITNFSCGPDSFLVGYVRDIMGNKPSLTLELDNHTADAGVNTRVEAFLDIIHRYRTLGVSDPVKTPFTPASITSRNGKWLFIASDGREYDMRDRRVKMLIPSMGKLTAELGAAAFRGFGINAEPVPVPDFPTISP
ncbi:acyl-CoA dehydratase activase, partial [Gemmatimonadota bacterium]